MANVNDVISAFKRLVGTSGTRIQSQYGMSGDWCAMTIWCGFQNAGASPNYLNGGKSAWVPFIMEWYQVNGSCGSTPQPGALVFYDWEPNGTPNHIEFCFEVTGASSFRTVAGNAGSSTVIYKDRTLSNVLTFAYPDYEVESEEKIPMTFIFQKNDEDALYFYDGGTVRYLTHPDEVTAIQMCYKACTGNDIPMFKLGEGAAPWASRFINAIIGNVPEEIPFN